MISERAQRGGRYGVTRDEIATVCRVCIFEARVGLCQARICRSQRTTTDGRALRCNRRWNKSRYLSGSLRFARYEPEKFIGEEKTAFHE